jgi:hypothetical protein
LWWKNIIIIIVSSSSSNGGGGGGGSGMVVVGWSWWWWWRRRLCRWCESKSIQERFDSHAAELADEAFERLIELREPEGVQVTDVVLKKRQLSTSAL